MILSVKNVFLFVGDEPDPLDKRILLFIAHGPLGEKALFLLGMAKPLPVPLWLWQRSWQWSSKFGNTAIVAAVQTAVSSTSLIAATNDTENSSGTESVLLNCRKDPWIL